MTTFPNRPTLLDIDVSAEIGEINKIPGLTKNVTFCKKKLARSWQRSWHQDNNNIRRLLRSWQEIGKEVGKLNEFGFIYMNLIHFCQLLCQLLFQLLPFYFSLSNLVIISPLNGIQCDCQLLCQLLCKKVVNFGINTMELLIKKKLARSWQKITEIREVGRLSIRNGLGKRSWQCFLPIPIGTWQVSEITANRSWHFFPTILHIVGGA